MMFRSRLFRWFLVLVALAGFGWLAFYSYATAELNRAIAETDAIDPGWRLKDIEAARAELPDAENSALAISAGHKLVPQGEKLFDAHECLNDMPHPSRRLTPQQVAAIQEVIAQNAPMFAEYRKVARMPRGHFPLTITDDVLGDALPLFSRVRHAAAGLRFDAYDRLEANDVPGATDRLVGCINIGRAIGDEPFIISTLVRITVDSMTLSGFERYLAQCEADDVTLARLQTELERVEAEPVYFWGVRGERGWSFAAFEQYKSQPSKASSYADSDAKSAKDYLLYVPGVISLQQAALLRHMNRVVAIARNSPETWRDDLEALDEDVKALPALAASAARNMSRIAQACQRHSANMRCMIAAIAAERYRVKHGQWPAKLDDLVAEKLLTKVPVDPYDGKPLRWKETPTGRIVYSVYRGGVDNGGELPRGKSPDETSDIGYELFDPAQRRQAPAG